MNFGQEGETCFVKTLFFVYEIVFLNFENKKLAIMRNTAFFLLVGLVFLGFAPVVQAQGEVDEEKKIFFRNEHSGGLVLNSNGFALNYRYGKRIDGYRKRLLEADLSLINHPKEKRISNPYRINSNRFVYGKVNSCLNLGGGIGFQKEVYSKFDKGGIAIRYYYSGGAQVALLKPIYYEIQYDAYVVREEKYDPGVHQLPMIIGTASYFKGISETQFVPGAYAKAGLSFDYSRRDAIVNSIEVGARVDVYLTELEIMSSTDNQQLFLNVFLSYRFGKIVSGRALSKEYKKKQRKLQRKLRREGKSQDGESQNSQGDVQL